MTLDPEIMFDFACPSCRAALTRSSDDLMRCENGHEYPRINGIWRMLSPEREAHFAKFISDYETIRAKEDRGSFDAAYYRNLPYGVTGRWADDWAIRAKSYEIVADLIKKREDSEARLFLIADIGAGNGWLSNRLAEQDHDVVSIDLLTNSLDGLGAYIHYINYLTPVQAEFDRIPLSDNQFDWIIFNASLHYSEGYTASLQEAMRLLHPNGILLIIDTPIYHSDASGQRMLAERQAHFEQTYGFRSDALRSEGYLTHARLAELGKSLGIRWTLIRPRYGLRWMIRRLIGRIRTRREPAEFYVILGTRTR